MSAMWIYIAEVMVVSALLMGGYSWLLERRTGFGICRAYLLLLPLCSLLIPLLQIPLWPAPTVTIPLSEPPVVRAELLMEPVAESFPLVELLLGILYGVGLLTILGAMALQYGRILTLRNGGEMSCREGVSVVYTLQPIAAFSFFRTVYLPQGLSAEEERVILRHECSHILHHHSAERLFMECEKALMWWNPFVWLASRRLMEVEEFQADYDVLKQGEEPDYYISIIFRQLFGYSPEIANGLRDSLTKKRFKMMKNNSKSRYARLRQAAIVPLMFGLVLAFGTTAKATQYRHASLPETETTGAEPEHLALPEQEANTWANDWQEAEVEPLNDLSTSASERVVEFEVPSEMWESVVRQEPLPLSDTIRVEEAKIYLSTETPHEEEPVRISMATFQGGDYQTFQGWVMERLHYPEEAAREGGSGTVFFTFVVKENGEIGDVDIIESSHKLFSREVERVVKTSPRWEPAYMEGKPAKQKFGLQVQFVPTETDSLPRYASEPSQVAQFQGGSLQDFHLWVMGQIRYPDEAVKEKIEGRVLVQFSVDVDGSVGDITILESPHESLSREVEGVMKRSPLWEPAVQDGEKKPVRFILPIDFAL